MKELRAHQVDAINMLRDRLRQSLAGKKRVRLMLDLCTGAGKTVIAAAIIRNARAKGKYVLFVVDAISLIDQTVQAFYAEGLHDIGVIQADHPMTDYSKPIQIASVQTLNRRGMPRADIIIVDEAHSQYDDFIAVMESEEWAETPIIGLSATPWSQGLGNVYDDLIKPVTMQELIDAGHLSQFRVYAASHPDLGNVKVTRGDYNEGQLSEVMSAGNLMADIVDTWKLRGGNQPTLAFCVDRAHAKHLQRRFEDAGVGCGYIDAYTKAPERRAIRDQLDRGEIKVVCNIGTLTKGVDWAIGCVILARPTRSEMLYVQMVGRGLRVNEGIPECVILDHADNTLRMGFVTDIYRPEMCKRKKGERGKSERKAPVPKECPSCAYLKPPKVAECPGCGFKPERQTDVKEEDGDLQEVKPKKAKASAADKQSWFAQLNWIAAERRYASGWVSHTYRAKFGVWPSQVDRASIAEPTPEVLSYVRSLMIRNARSRAA